MIRRIVPTLALIFSLALPGVASAVDTQLTIDARIKQILINYAHVPPANIDFVMSVIGIPKIYATAAELAAASPAEGTIGYASDSNVFYLRVGASWTSIASIALLENGATITNPVDGTVTITEGGETEQHVFTNNLITITSSSGATYTFTPAVNFSSTVGITGATTATGAIYANGGVDRSTAATLAIGGANATAVTITPATTITGLTTATGGLSTTKPLFVYSRLRFCGNGSNGTTPWFDGPQLMGDVNNAGTAVDVSTGSAFCDANDSATEATADRPLDAITTIKIVALECSTQAGGTSNTNTFQLRTAGTTDVSGATCAVTNDGANPKTCTVVLAAPVAITVGATLAVKNVQSGSDDMSAKDMECYAFYTN